MIKESGICGAEDGMTEEERMGEERGSEERRVSAKFGDLCCSALRPGLRPLTECTSVCSATFHAPHREGLTAPRPSVSPLPRPLPSGTIRGWRTIIAKRIRHATHPARETFNAQPITPNSAEASTGWIRLVIIS